MTEPAPPSRTTLHLCVSCRGEGKASPGRALLAAVSAPLEAAGIAVCAAECLAVCRRPATVALTSPGRWTYVVGDIDPEHDAADLVDGVIRYARSDNGIVPWRERPLCLRRGVVARVPPPGTNAGPEEIAT